MKVLYVIQNLVAGGASYAAIDLAKGIMEKNKGIRVHFFTSFVKESDRLILASHVSITVGDERDLLKLCANKKFNFIHWFRTDSKRLFTNAFKLGGPALPILLTHCQLPSTYELMLSPREINQTSRFVFICKTAFNHRFHEGISAKVKSMIYFGTNSDRVISQSRETSKVVKLGRGSTLNKCPKSLINTFKRADRDATFTIVGKGDQTRLRRQIRKYGLEKSVFLVDHLSRSEWLDFINDIDIFYYYIPSSAYSAIDRTIQDAMLARKPVVYKGPEGPAELIDHEKTGFIAYTEEELVYYLRQLIDDKELREQLGDKGQERIVQNFNHQTTVDQYIAEYEIMLNETPSPNTFKASFSYLITYSVFAVAAFFKWKYRGLLKRLDIYQ